MLNTDGFPVVVANEAANREIFLDADCERATGEGKGNLQFRDPLV